MPSITDSIGRVLGDRYRLVTPLGTGASAHVYLADDISLHRRVAIKVLHPALAGDTAFLKRFRAEARAAAALNHPNILQVFDWGEQRDEPYLVLEYLSGGSLRQVFDTGTLLTPEQAVRVGVEAAAGLDYAHRRGLVHRDIKPANLLLDGERRLRIADFGLARALAEAAWTEPTGAVLGTARYAAPEQVEGKSLDGRADVFALALVLYEAVAGVVPFAADTTIATLMGRVGATLPTHERLGLLHDVLVWAAAPNPADRYTAAQLAVELRQLGSVLPPPEPLPILATGPGSAGSSAHSSSGADRLVSDPSAPRFPVPISPDRGVPGDDDRTELGTPSTAADRLGAADRQSTVGAVADHRDSAQKPVFDWQEPTSAPVPIRRRRRRWPWVVAAAVVLAAVLAAGAVLAVHDKLFTPSHPVPSLVGMTVASARHAVAKDHFAVTERSHRYDNSLAAGRIVSQQPAPATGRHAPPVTAKQGTTIGVVVSQGPQPVDFPNLTTFTDCNDAVNALQALHLKGVCPTSAEQYSDTAPVGAILGSTPAGVAPYGSTVTISTSKGHQPVAVPAAVAAGAAYATAVQALQAVGFVVAENKEYNATIASGSVIDSTPSATSGPQPYGSTVTVDVSLGPKPVAVPSLNGDTVAAATTALQAQGLSVGNVYGPAGGKVFDMNPDAGTQVLPGTSVDLYTK